MRGERRFRAIAYEISTPSPRRKLEYGVCGILDFLNLNTEFGHWIPAKAGMTGVNLAHMR